MTTVLVMMNNYFHDFATALLIANLALFAIFTKGLQGPLSLTWAQKDVVFGYAKRITHLSLAWILVGGAIRTWHYSTFEWVEAAGKGQIAALGVKHMVMGTAVFVGLYLQWKLTREHAAERLLEQAAK